MDRQTFIKNILLGFLPLLMFVAADSFLSEHYPEAEATRYALLLGIGMGISQALFVYFKEQRLDKMILLDTLLIVGMGGFSLLSGDKIFFKMKPALVQLVTVLFLGFVAFVKPKLLASMSGRFMKDREISEAQLNSMQHSAQGLALVLFLHTLLIVYAALSMSKGAWAFISGPLIYIIMGVYFLGMMGWARWKRRTVGK